MKNIILQKGRGKSRKLAKLSYIYEKESLYFAQVSETVKTLAQEELAQLNGREIKPVFRGIWFKASKKDFYRITYHTRLCSRILAPLAIFDCPDKDVLYKTAKTIAWEEFLTPRKTFSMVANVSESNITHSNFAGLRVKDAIVDYFRDRTNKRPNVDSESPYVIFHLHIHQNRATLSLDASAGSLHKRGYREESVSAPMQETVAAAIIRTSQWDGETRLYDPMCGSGTLLCEALMHHCRIPAQMFKEEFGFQRLPDFDAALWETIKAESAADIRSLASGLIAGSDKDEFAVNATKTNLMGLHHGSRVPIVHKPFQELEPMENTTIITNPPYGIRMGRDDDMNRFYRELGDFLKEKCKGCTAYVYFGDPKYIKKVSLAPSWKRNLVIGALEGKLVKYDIFK